SLNGVNVVRVVNEAKGVNPIHYRKEQSNEKADKFFDRRNSYGNRVSRCLTGFRSGSQPHGYTHSRQQAWRTNVNQGRLLHQVRRGQGWGVGCAEREKGSLESFL